MADSSGIATIREVTAAALVRERYGDASVLSTGERAVVAPGPTEVLVAVEAVAVNASDLFHLTGTPLIARLAFGMPHPHSATIGRAVAGRVAAVGGGVAELSPGDRVVGESGGDGFGRYATGPATRFTILPEHLSAVEAATLPVSGTTALRAVREARLSAGDRVLVTGAAGGVGSFAVQLARHAGAQVTALCRDAKAAWVRELGAHRVLDQVTVDPTRMPERYDAIIDLAGAHPVSAYRRILTRTGRLVVSTGSGGRVLGPLPRMAAAAALGPFVPQRLVSFTDPGGREPLDELLALLGSGALRPPVDRVYPFAEAVDALRDFAAGRVRGKLVVDLTR